MGLSEYKTHFLILPEHTNGCKPRKLNGEYAHYSLYIAINKNKVFFSRGTKQYIQITVALGWQLGCRKLVQCDWVGYLVLVMFTPSKYPSVKYPSSLQGFIARLQLFHSL